MSMNVDILNMKGEKVGDYTIDDTCLEFDKGAQAVHDAVVAFLAENRAGTASVKTRAEVAGSGKKPFKQKGLGRARAGSVRNPVWRHGGHSFGPKPRDYGFKLPIVSMTRRSLWLTVLPLPITRPRVPQRLSKP